MSTVIDFNTLSTEWLKFTVVTDVNLMGLPVSVAIVAPGSIPSTFVAAEWVVDQPGHGRVLVGPGTSLVMSTGIFDVWVKIEADPEAPVMNAGRIRVR